MTSLLQYIIVSWWKMSICEEKAGAFLALPVLEQQKIETFINDVLEKHHHDVIMARHRKTSEDKENSVMKFLYHKTKGKS